MNSLAAYNDKLKNDLRDAVVLHHDKLWLPRLNAKSVDINTNSCFDFKQLRSANSFDVEFKDFKSSTKKLVTNSIQVLLFPTDRQKIIIGNWFDACTDMYNESVRYIKSVLPFKDLVRLRELSDQKFLLYNQIDALKKTIDSLKKQNVSLFKYISTDRLRSKKNLIIYHDKLNKYIINMKT